MSLFLFTRNILAGEPIQVFNYGHHARDFTYIDDAVEGVLRTLDTIATPDPDWRPEAPDPATSSAPYRLYNIGNHSPVALLDYIAAIEKALGQQGQDRAPAATARATWRRPMRMSRRSRRRRDSSRRRRSKQGIERFVAWYRDYYRV